MRHAYNWGSSKTLTGQTIILHASTGMAELQGLGLLK